MQIEQLPGCCGVAEIQNLQDTTTGKEAMEAFWEQCVDRDDYCGVGVDEEKVLKGISYLYIFNGVVSGGEKYCQRFAAYIAKNNLGEVVSNTTPTLNPNHTDHKIKCYIWTVNWKNLIAWAKKEGLSPLVEESAYDAEEWDY